MKRFYYKLRGYIRRFYRKAFKRNMEAWQAGLWFFQEFADIYGDSINDINIAEKFRDSLPDYYQGVMEGWTVLVTAMKIDNLVVLPGKRTRKEMIEKLSPEFWEAYKDFEFKFIDGTVVSKH